MPEKQPDVWAAIIAQLSNYFIKQEAMIYVALCSAVITVGKMLSDKKRDTFWGVFTEALISAFVVGAAFKLLKVLGYHEDFVYGVGLLLCLFGTNIIRAVIINWLKKIGVLDENS